jgi:hypothetical protein
MANSWLRLWHDMPNDPKWRTIAKISGQPISCVIAIYLHMLINASNATERGRTESWNDEDVASALDIEIKQVCLVREAMQGRVLDGDYLTGWDKRQPIREDGAAERAKAWREAKKLEKKTNATERNQTLDKDKDKDKDKDRESKKEALSQKSKLSSDWWIIESWGDWSMKEFGWDEKKVINVADKFKINFLASGAEKEDWEAAWQLWCFNEK